MELDFISALIGIILGIGVGFYFSQSRRSFIDPSGTVHPNYLHQLDLPDPTYDSYVAGLNSVVAGDIDVSEQFLVNFFEPNSSGAQNGQIWLYQSDLLAFQSDLLFDRLYRTQALRWSTVSKVRIVISSSALNPLVRSDSTRSAKERKRLLHQLKEVWSNISNNLSTANHGKIEACWDTDVKLLSPDFRNFVSDEAWIFYVRQGPLGKNPKICIHRRFVKVAELASAHTNHDDRITVTAYFPKPLHKRYPDHSPMVKFITRDYLATFEDIYTKRPIAWQPFRQLALEAIANTDTLLEDLP